VLSEEFGLRRLAVGDALDHSQRPKLGHYRSHLFLTGYGTRLDTGTGGLATSEIAAFITGKALITVRKYGDLDIRAVVQRWNESPTSLDSGCATCCTSCWTTSSMVRSRQCRAWMAAWRSWKTGVRRRSAGPEDPATELLAAQEPRAAPPDRSRHERGSQRTDAP
jgi:hypothetical protein